MARKGISRRQFIESSVAGVAAGKMSELRAFAAEPGGTGPVGEEAGPGHRITVSVNSDWRFKRQGTPGAGIEPEFIGAEKPGYNDSAWQEIVVPHTWDASPDNPFAAPGHFRGVGWYRRNLEVPQSWRGRRLRLHFNGVFQITDVWVNGRRVGRHTGGYTSFVFDVTAAVEFGKTNVIAVKVDDVLSPFIAPAEERNVANYGGIYRSVWLEVLDPVHIRYNGTWVTLEGDEERPVVRIRTWVENQSGSQRKVRVESEVVDAAGKSRAKVQAEAGIGAGQEKSLDQKTEAISDPHLWSPDSPYLYHLVTTLFEGDRTLDRYVTRFGIRFMGHDASGFILNGKPINLHGVDRRQDYGFLGDAVPEAVGIKDVRLIKEMGANFIRTAHYPQDPAVLNACDELGILVWEEVPNIAVHIYPPDEEGAKPVYTTRFPRPLMDNLKHQLREMIERDRNRPSVIIWGFADDLSTYKYPEDFVELSDYTHMLDPDRWTAGRCPHVTDIMDATSYDDLLQAHKEHPENKYIWNEWGAISCERGLEGPGLIEDRRIQAVSDCEMALSQEGLLMQWNALPWLGTAKWCMFDCGEPNGSVTRSLWAPEDGRMNLRWPFNDYLGVSDMWRIPKNAYFFLQSQWTEKPMVHIVGHWTWPEDAGRSRTVRIYSNCDTVELFLNGHSLGAQKPATQDRVWQDFRQLVEKYHEPEQLSDQFAKAKLPGAHLRHPPFVWDDVAYQQGNLLAVGKKGSVTVRHEIRTAGAAKRIVLKPDKKSIVADGADVVFLQADVVDSAGTVVPTAQNWIAFSATGPGRLLGGAKEIDAISGTVAINVQSIGEAGEIVVRATTPGLDSATLRIAARKA
ncbi:MAG TPA: glycoside hydrolase family 2 TIM barrel-domain containing protein [Terriglobia bacterium]|nr:glycoside hydrolase family 2 TIM barrel-domain containing protein [Terriglobia bacterium]